MIASEQKLLYAFKEWEAEKNRKQELPCDISDKGLAKWRDDAILKIKFEIDNIRSNDFWDEYMAMLRRQSVWDFISDRWVPEEFPLPEGF